MEFDQVLARVGNLNLAEVGGAEFAPITGFGNGAVKGVRADFE